MSWSATVTSRCFRGVPAPAAHLLIRSSPLSSAATSSSSSSFKKFVAGSAPQRRLRQVAGHISLRAMSGTVDASGFAKVNIKRNGDGETAFDAYVTGSEGAPGIVVLQEWWGVDFEIKNHASAIAKSGYRTLIPDLYRGKVGLDAEEAKHLMSGLDWQGAVKDVAASAKWLKESGSSKVGATGFCMGGALAVASAVLIPEVDAVVAFYGVPSPGLADTSKVKVPVQAHFGEVDGNKGFSDIGTAKELEKNLKASGVPSEVFIYPGQGHAFMNSSEEAIKRKKAVGFADHDQDAVNLGWSRFHAWFEKYLKA